MMADQMKVNGNFVSPCLKIIVAMGRGGSKYGYTGQQIKDIHLSNGESELLML